MRNHSNDEKVLKAFCDINRLKILEMLRSGEKCACTLLEELNIRQPTLSHHMKILCESGIVSGRKDGKWIHYSINNEGALRAQKLLKELTTQTNENTVSKFKEK